MKATREHLEGENWKSTPRPPKTSFAMKKGAERPTGPRKALRREGPERKLGAGGGENRYGAHPQRKKKNRKKGA